MLAEFLKLIFASVLLNIIEGRYPVAPLLISSLTFTTVVLSAAILMFILGRHEYRRFPYGLKLQLAYILALGFAILFDMVYALPMHLTEALGMSARNWGVPAIIELLLFVLLWLASIFPILIVDGLQTGLERLRFFAGMIAVPFALICFAELLSESLVLMPIGIIIAFAEIPFAIYILLALMALLVILLFPVLLTKIWRTRKLTDPVLTQILMGMAGKAKTGIRSILIWNTRGMRNHNALVTGFVMPFRYVLLTDAMIEDFPRPYVTAVFAHEITHARKRHFPLLLLTGLSLLCTVALVESALSNLGLDEITAATCGFLSIVPFVILLLGPLYRHLERQADIEGAELLENPGLMASALSFLGNFIPAGKRKRSFTHYGLDKRVAILLECSADPAFHEKLMNRIRRNIRLLLLPVVLLIALAGVSLFMRTGSLLSQQWLLTSEICVERGDVEHSAYCLERSLMYKHEPDVRLFLALHYLDLDRNADAREILTSSQPDDAGMFFVLKNELKHRKFDAGDNISRD